MEPKRPSGATPGAVQEKHDFLNPLKSVDTLADLRKGYFGNGPAEFVRELAQPTYTSVRKGLTSSKKFGLSRSTTVLHFLSGGEFPICDSRVRRAIRRLTGGRAPNTVEWYLKAFRDLFQAIATECGALTKRSVDKALFAYGGKQTRKG